MDLYEFVLANEDINVGRSRGMEGQKMMTAYDGWMRTSAAEFLGGR